MSLSPPPPCHETVHPCRGGRFHATPALHSHSLSFLAVHALRFAEFSPRMAHGMQSYSG